MNKYEAIDAIKVSDGIVELDESQAKRRKNFIEKITPGKPDFKVKKPFEFKAGEVFGYDGELPKSANKIVKPKPDAKPKVEKK